MIKDVLIQHGNIQLEGQVNYQDNPKAWIIFIHGSGSSKNSKRNNFVAQELNKQGFSTLIFDLLIPEENDFFPNRFNIPLLSERLLSATSWLMNSVRYHGEKIGYFGASTGAAAALMAAVEGDPSFPVFAIVSRGGRGDLVQKEILNDCFIPTLLIVGGEDGPVIKLNKLVGEELLNSTLNLVPGAGHLFEESGALEEVAHLSVDWFNRQIDYRHDIDKPLELRPD